MTPNDRMPFVLRLTPVTPLHIGSGELYTNIDYAIRNGRFEVKDVRKFIEAHRDNPEYAVNAIESGLDIGPEFVRYALPCYLDGQRTAQAAKKPQMSTPLRGTPPAGKAKSAGKFTAKELKAQREAERKFGPSAAPEPPPRRDTKSRGEVRAFMRDPFDRPFIPATSVKGMLRTAIACAIAQNAHIDPGRITMDAIERGSWLKRERAFGDANKRLFGGVIEDVMKAFVLGDSGSLDFGHGFAMCSVRIMNVMLEGFREKTGAPIQVEALTPGAGTVELRGYIDRFRLRRDTDMARSARGAGVALLSDWNALLRAFQEQSKELLQIEHGFHDDQKAPTERQFFAELARDGAIYLPLGFGTGWWAKTTGRIARPEDIYSIRKYFGKYDSDRPNKNMGSPRVELFPKTRKQIRDRDGWKPMGWVKVEFERA